MGINPVSLEKFCIPVLYATYELVEPAEIELIATTQVATAKIRRFHKYNIPNNNRILFNSGTLFSIEKLDLGSSYGEVRLRILTCPDPAYKPLQNMVVYITMENLNGLVCARHGWV